MTTVIYYHCPKCRRPLDFGLARLQNGDLIADCGKCREPVVLERDLRCKICGRPATDRQMGSDLAGPVISTYFCGEHFAAFREARVRRRRTFGLYALPGLGALFLGLGLLVKGENGKPVLLLFLMAALCAIQSVVLWRRLRGSTRS